MNKHTYLVGALLLAILLGFYHVSLAHSLDIGGGTTLSLDSAPLSINSEPASVPRQISGSSGGSAHHASKPLGIASAFSSFLSSLYVSPRSITLDHEGLHKLAITDAKGFYNFILQNPSLLDTKIPDQEINQLEISGTLTAEHYDDLAKGKDVPVYWLAPDDGGDPIMVNPLENVLEDGQEIQADVVGYKIDDMIVGTVLPKEGRGDMAGDASDDESDGSPDGGMEGPLAPGESDGVQDVKLGVVLVQYQNAAVHSPISNADMYDRVFNGPVHDFFSENSYGKVNLTGDVYGWYTIAEDEPAVCPFFNPPSSILSDHHIAAGSYDLIFMIINCNGTYIGSGAAYSSPANGITNIGIINEFYASPWGVLSGQIFLDRLFMHELGHSMGKVVKGGSMLSHEQGLDCGDQMPFSPTGVCHSVEYGSFPSMMGLGTLGDHFNAYTKNYLGWIPKEDIVKITGSGNYTLTPIEKPGAKVAYINFPKKPIEIEYRTSTGFDTGLATGLYVSYVAPRNGGNERQTFLLDVHPNDKEWGDDVAHANISHTDVYDGEGFTIGPITHTESGSDPSISFNVTLDDDYQCNNAPVVKISHTSYNEVTHKHYISYEVKNIDPFPCKKTTFDGHIEAPAGFVIGGDIPDPQTFTLYPFGGYLTASYSYIPPADLALGDYLITYVATNSKHPQKSASITYTYSPE